MPTTRRTSLRVTSTGNTSLSAVSPVCSARSPAHPRARSSRTRGRSRSTSVGQLDDTEGESDNESRYDGESGTETENRSRSASQARAENEKKGRERGLTIGQGCSRYCEGCLRGKKLASPCLYLTDKRYVTFNPQIFNVVRINDTEESITLDMGITFEWHDPEVAKEARHQRKVRGGNGSLPRFSSHPYILRIQGNNEGMELWPETDGGAQIAPGDHFFDPAWKIQNSSETTIIKNITNVWDAEYGHVHQFIHLVATFPQPLNLSTFPFDIQTIAAQITTEHPSKYMELVRDEKRPPKIYITENSEWYVTRENIDPNSDSQDRICQLFFQNEDKWESRKNIQPGSSSGTAMASSGLSYAQAQLQFRVQRKHGWYIYQLFLVCFLVVLASFSGFALTSEESSNGGNTSNNNDIMICNSNHAATPLNDRLSIVFTTWLLLISLKFVVSDRLPKINYLTLLDYYINATYCLMIFMVVYFTAIHLYLIHHDCDSVITEGDSYLLLLRHLDPVLDIFGYILPEGVLYIFKTMGNGEGYWMFILLTFWMMLHAVMLICLFFVSWRQYTSDIFRWSKYITEKARELWTCIHNIYKEITSLD
jgi:hypothetical protein